MKKEELEKKLREYCFQAGLEWPVDVILAPKMENLALEVIPISKFPFYSHLLYIPGNFSFTEENIINLKIALSLAKFGELTDPCLEDFKWVVTSLPKEEAKRRVKLFCAFSLLPVYVPVIELMKKIFGKEVFDKWLQLCFESLKDLLDNLKEEKIYLISNTLVPLEAHAIANRIETWFSIAGLLTILKRSGAFSYSYEKLLEEILVWDRTNVFNEILSIFLLIPFLDLPKTQIIKRMEVVISLIFKEILKESWAPKIVFSSELYRNIWRLDDI